MKRIMLLLSVVLMVGVAVGYFMYNDGYAATQQNQNATYTLNWSHNGIVTTRSSVWVCGKQYVINAKDVKNLCPYYKVTGSINVKGQFIKFEHNKRYNIIQLKSPEGIIAGSNIMYVDINHIPSWMLSDKAKKSIKKVGKQYYIYY